MLGRVKRMLRYFSQARKIILAAAQWRGAFDPSCASWPSDPVGTKGVPPINRHPCGASNKGQFFGYLL
jgi:hypothetical protein